jgi:hypothetical protein
VTHVVLVLQAAAAAGRGPKQRGSRGSCSPDGSADDDQEAWEARLLKPLPVSGAAWKGGGGLGGGLLVAPWVQYAFPWVRCDGDQDAWEARLLKPLPVGEAPALLARESCIACSLQAQCVSCFIPGLPAPCTAWL